MRKLSVYSATSGFAILILVWAGTGAPASGAGSIISSFRLSGYSSPYANGLYVGDNFVSVIFAGSGPDYIYRFRFDGTQVGSYAISGTSTPRGGDQTHLGNGYISMVDLGNSYFFIFRVRGGSPISSFPVTVPGTGQLQDVMWTGSYYEVTDHWGNGRFNRYTPAGSFAGSVSYTGWPAGMTSTGAVSFSNIADQKSGAYLVASPRSNGQPSCILDINGAGSLVSTFPMPSFFASGGCVGRASNRAKFGDAYWVTWIVSGAIWCYQVDIGAKQPVTIVPTSVGKIKALYR